MLLVYASITGNVRAFVDEVGMDSIELSLVNPLIEVNEDYIIVIPTYEGELNDEISEFIEHSNNQNHLVGFAGSGNINFGDDLFCINVKQLSAKYDKPIIFTFEYSGTEDDVKNFRKEVREIAIARTTKEI